MKKRRFYLALLFLLPFLTASAAELRGIWVDAFGPGFLNSKQVKQLVSDCRQYNFNAVFVQMRKRGDAFYFPKPPNEDPRNHNLAPEFDALAEIIHECHDQAQPIQVHCWLTAYLVWTWHNPPDEAEHVFNRHPEYLMKDSIGQRMVGEGYYLDPGNPDANTGLLNTARDIVSRYDIDGLHWDYLRYPTQDSGYSPTALKRYQEEFSTPEGRARQSSARRSFHQLDPGAHGVTRPTTTEIPSPSDARFCEWRRRQLTDFVRWSSAELLEIKPQLIISAAVFSNYKDAYNAHFQDWTAWNREGIIDMAIPMNFSADHQHIFMPRANFASSNQWNRAVWIGQAAYLNPKENTLKQLQFCRSNGFGGTVLYSYRNPSKETTAVSNDTKPPKQKAALTFIKENFQPQWETAPLLLWKKHPSKGIIKGTVKDRDGKLIYNATVKLLDSPERTQKTEPHGCFAFFEVAPGEHQIEVSATNGKPMRKKVTIKAGQVASIGFVMADN